MALKLNKDGSVDKRWKPQTEAEMRELLAYERRQLLDKISDTRAAIRKACQK